MAFMETLLPHSLWAMLMASDGSCHRLLSKVVMSVYLCVGQEQIFVKSDGLSGLLALKY